MNLATALCLTLLVSLASACTDALEPLQPEAKSVNTNADEDAVREAVESFWMAFNSKDLDALISLFTDDAVLMIPGHPAIEGVEDIREHYTPAFSGDWEWNLSMSPNIKTVIITNDWAFCHIQYSGVSTDGNREIATNSKALRIYCKQPDGRWKLAYDIFNRDGSPPQE